MAMFSTTHPSRFWRSDQFFNIEMAHYSLSNHSFPRHFHNYYVIELVIAGADSFYCAGNNYTATQGQVVLINPGEVHTGNTVPGHDLHYYSMYPDVQMMHTITEILEIKSPAVPEFSRSLVSNPAISRQLGLLFGGLENYVSANNRTTDLLEEEELFFNVMYSLLTQNKAGLSRQLLAGEKDKRITMVIDYMRSHFRHNISLQQMAELVSINPYHLIRIFKNAMGISPYDYLVNLRIEYARTLLRKNIPVADTAVKAGFYDASHFNRLFKKMTGASPKYFRPS